MKPFAESSEQNKHAILPVLQQEFAQRQALSQSEMVAMIEAGVDFQGHTRLHPILTTCTDQECWAETATAKTELEQLLQQPVTHFAYPNGDYGPREIAYLQQAGYRSGRTIDVGWNDRRASRYALKAMVISDDASVNEMVAQLCGLLPYLRYLRQGSWRGKHPVTKSDEHLPASVG